MARSNIFELGYSLDRLTAIFNEMLAPINEIAEQIDDVNKNLLGTGRTLDKTFGATQPLLKSLPGSIAKNFESATEQLTEGFLDVNKDISKLAVQERLTNQNSLKTIKQLKTLQTTMGLSNNQVGDLSDAILKTSVLYKTKTEDLVDALDRTKGSLLNVSLIGGNTKALAEAIAKASGRFRGTEARDRLGDLINWILDTKNVNEVVLNDLYDLRQKLVTNPTEDDILEVVEKSHQILDKMLATTDNSFDQLTSLGMLKDIVGEGPIIAKQLDMLQDTLEKSTDTSHYDYQEFFKSLTTFLETIRRPIDFVAVKMTEMLIGMPKWLLPLLEIVSAVGALSITLTAIGTTLNIMLAFQKIQVAQSGAISGIFNAAVTIVKFMGFLAGGLSVILGGIAIWGAISDMLGSTQDETKKQTELLKKQNSIMQQAEDRRSRNEIKPGDWKDISGKAISDAINDYVNKVKQGKSSATKEVQGLLEAIYHKLDEIKNATMNNGNAIQDSSLGSVKGAVAG